MDFCQARFTFTRLFTADCRFDGYRDWVFLDFYFYRVRYVFLPCNCVPLYLVNEWISNRPYDIPPNLDGIWGALLFNVYRAQRQERIVQAEMVGLIDRAQSSLVALAEAVVLIDELHQIEWWNPAAEKLLGIQPLDRGRNILTLLRQPNFIEYFNNIDQAPTA